MRNLIDQLDQSAGQRLYYVSLFTALTIPDIAGAMDAEDGRATGERYAAWFEEWVRPIFGEQASAKMPAQIRARVTPPENPLTGLACYQFRCSLLHQGTSQHPASPYERIIFIEPGATTNAFHGCQLGGALAIDLPTFCREMVIGARRWVDRVENTERYIANYDRFARRHPDGLSPYITGVPVVG